jgi:hypothetical protein
MKAILEQFTFWGFNIFQALEAFDFTLEHLSNLLSQSSEFWAYSEIIEVYHSGWFDSLSLETYY